MSVDDHRTTPAGDNERRERAADVEGSDEEGEGGKGDGELGWQETRRAKVAKALGIGNEGGMRQRG